MSTINLNLSDSVHDYLRERVASGKNKSMGEFLEQLAVEAMNREKQERLDRLMEKSLASESIPCTPGWGQRMFEEFKARRGLA